MWSNLPLDLLLHIFSSLSPQSLARAGATCRNWNVTARPGASLAARRRLHPPWFVALPTRSWSNICCYAHNPIEQNWIELHLRHTITSVKPIATIGGLIIFKCTKTSHLSLAICNPFTNQFRLLPPLKAARTNPAVGAVENSCSDLKLGFRIYVAGGMREASYEPTVETYDSISDKWEMIGGMPVELAVRLTVWSPKESVYWNGTLYWMTSARAYSVMGFHILSNKWRELSIPMADRLDLGALVAREGKLVVVGGECGGDAGVWELGAGDMWKLAGRVPAELGVKLLGEKVEWGSAKCVGNEGGVWLYKDLGSGFIVWRDAVTAWTWVQGQSQLPNLPIKGLLLQPYNLTHLF